MKFEADEKEYLEERRVYEKVYYTPAFYICHLYLIIYILVGISIQAFSYLNGGPYRVVSTVTWPYVITSNASVMVLSVILYSVAMIFILLKLREKVAEFDTGFFSLLPYFIYFLGGFIMLGRMFAMIISP